MSLHVNLHENQAKIITEAKTEKNKHVEGSKIILSVSCVLMSVEIIIIYKGI
jgi:hypothetical protein